MKIETLIMAGKAAFGEHWVSPMSEALGVSDRTVRHWVAGKYKIPAGIRVDVLDILQSRTVTIVGLIDMIKNGEMISG